METSTRRHRPRLVEAVRVVLDSHTHFCGRLDRFVWEEVEGVVAIQGAVPSFYLKHLLQSLVREIEGVRRVINRVEVVCGHGLSSCSERTRERCALEYAWLGKRPTCFSTCQATPGDPQERERRSISQLMS